MTQRTLEKFDNVISVNCRKKTILREKDIKGNIVERKYRGYHCTLELKNHPTYRYFSTNVNVFHFLPSSLNNVIGFLDGEIEFIFKPNTKCTILDYSQPMLKKVIIRNRLVCGDEG